MASRRPMACRQFATKGSCRFGNNCRYSHDAPEPAPGRSCAKPAVKGGSQVCRMFKKQGRCRFGANCRFTHETAKPVGPAGSIGSPAPGRTTNMPFPVADYVLPAPPAAEEQSFTTYFDEKTGHHRLKGGALLIVDPDWTEEQAKEAQVFTTSSLPACTNSCVATVISPALWLTVLCRCPLVWSFTAKQKSKQSKPCCQSLCTKL